TRATCHLPPQLREHAVAVGDSVIRMVPAQLLVEFVLLHLHGQLAVLQLLGICKKQISSNKRDWPPC
ncbi:MAG: hypothetical protein ACI9NC_004050, partial [Verrucomicrobiales bacterium]